MSHKVNSYRCSSGMLLSYRFDHFSIQEMKDMREGYYRLTRQSPTSGTFAGVRLSVTSVNQSPINISVSPEVTDQYYVPAVITGINFAQERLIVERKNPPRVNVTILEIQTSNVDTTVMAVVMAACFAFCDAIGCSLETTVELDDKVGFIFGI